MGELAKVNSEQPVSLVEISRRHGVSVPFLKKIVRSLRAARLVQSKEGVGGGYTLAREPETISMWDIISAFDGIAGETNSGNTVCPINTFCLPQHIRAKLSESIKKQLEKISLKEVAR